MIQATIVLKTGKVFIGKFFPTSFGQLINQVTTGVEDEWVLGDGTVVMTSEIHEIRVRPQIRED